MYIVRDQAGQSLHINSLEEVAQIMQLDPHEIAWAFEAYGRCETDTHCVVVDEEARSAGYRPQGLDCEPSDGS